MNFTAPTGEPLFRCLPDIRVTAWKRRRYAKRSKKRKPDLIGISSSFAAYSREAAEIAAIAKEIDQRIITVMGGTHPTLFPHIVLNDGNVDYVVRGEGETPFFELVRDLRSVPVLCRR